jgi:thiamine pyrophosphokinase
MLNIPLRIIRNIVIIANGEEIKQEIIKKELIDDPIIIAVDGGLLLCKKLNIIPHYILGDFDSIPVKIIEEYDSSKLISKPNQNLTDLQKSLEFASSLNPRKIKIFAVTGKRTDHTFANLLIFTDYKGKAILQLFDNYGIMKLHLPGKHLIDGKKGQRISFFSLKSITKLSLLKVKYPIININITGHFFSLSNEFISDKCLLEFKEGKIISYIIL